MVITVAQHHQAVELAVYSGGIEGSPARCKALLQPACLLDSVHSSDREVQELVPSAVQLGSL